jgi:hypothetical protein
MVEKLLVAGEAFLPFYARDADGSALYLHYIRHNDNPDVLG